MTRLVLYGSFLINQDPRMVLTLHQLTVKKICSQLLLRAVWPAKTLWAGSEETMQVAEKTWSRSQLRASEPSCRTDGWV